MLPTGITLPYFGSTAPEGWLLLNGQTIGTPTSGATAKASFDTWPLYSLLWDSTSLPVEGGRGFDADQDFAANKALSLPDARGRVIAGADPAGTVLPASAPGDVLGESNHVLSFAEMPGHNHTMDYSKTVDNGGGGSTTATVNNDTTTGTVTSGFSAEAHNNVQPTLVANWIIKL
jgi:microcystin-dependent protein